MRSFHEVSSLCVLEISARQASAFAFPLLPGSLLCPAGLSSPCLRPDPDQPNARLRAQRWVRLQGTRPQHRGCPGRRARRGLFFHRRFPWCGDVLPCWMPEPQRICVWLGFGRVLKRFQFPLSWAGADGAGSSLTEEVLGIEFYVCIRAWWRLH